MSNSKRGRRKSFSLASSNKKSNNHQMFKLLDPLVQSALFIFFIFSLDAQTHFPYRYILVLLITWQVLSAVINLILFNHKQLLSERIAFLVAILVYTGYYVFSARSAHEIKLPKTGSTSQIITFSVGMLLSFWYNILCYREFRSNFGKINRGNGR